MKIRAVGAELFHADGHTDRHDEANSRSSQFCECTWKCVPIPLFVTQILHGLAWNRTAVSAVRGPPKLWTHTHTHIYIYANCGSYGRDCMYWDFGLLHYTPCRWVEYILSLDLGDDVGTYLLNYTASHTGKPSLNTITVCGMFCTCVCHSSCMNNYHTLQGYRAIHLIEIDLTSI